MPFQVAHRVIFLVSSVNMGINIWNLKNWANWPNMANPSIPLLWVNHFVLKSLVPLASILKTLGRSGPPKLSKELVTSKSIGEKTMFPLKWPLIIDLPSGTVRHWNVHHAIKNGEPSISIRAIYTMAMLVITRGYIYNGYTVTYPIFKQTHPTVTFPASPGRYSHARNHGGDASRWKHRWSMVVQTEDGKSLHFWSRDTKIKQMITRSDDKDW